MITLTLNARQFTLPCIWSALTTATAFELECSGNRVQVFIGDVLIWGNGVTQEIEYEETIV